jgi:hypothetical protein
MGNGLIKSQITDGEVIEGQYNDEWSIWLLTNKRIIRYYKTGAESVFEDLDYRYIVSIRIVEIGHIWRLVFGIPVLLIGLWFLMYSTRDTIATSIGLILTIVGIILIWAALLKDRNCEIIAHGTKPWITNGNLRGLTRDIRNHLAPFSLPLTSLSEIMVKDEEKTFCSNCGGKISIYYKFCRHCGNKLCEQ